MYKSSFEEIRFSEDKEFIIGHFLKIFRFKIEKKEILELNFQGIEDGQLVFGKDSEKKFNRILSSAFKGLFNSLSQKPTTYIHSNSNIPVIGSNAFGLVDRGSSIIEVKPITGCNLRCIYCSVDENKRGRDFVIEKDYLVNEFIKLSKAKGDPELEAHISSQGEPMFYEPLADLVRDLSNIPSVKRISIDTNACLLTKKKVHELSEAGITQFNISINSINQEVAERIANAPYNVNKIIEIIKEISNISQVVVAPVFLPGINDKDVEKIIEIAPKNAKIGIQNYLSYKFGRNPIKGWDMDKFFKHLKELEKKFDRKLIWTKEDFHIVKTHSIPVPFKKGEIIKARIFGDGRFNGEKLSVSEGRIITIPKCSLSGNVKLKLTRSKHNIFYGVPI